MKTLLSRFNVNYFFGIPAETQIVWFWFACFALLLLVSVGVYLYLKAKGLSRKPYKKYAKSFLWPNLTLAIIGLVLTFARYEKLALFSYRFWVYVTILGVITFNAWFFTFKRSQLEDELLKFYNNARKAKWLKSNKK